MLSETLDKGAHDHNERPAKDGPPAAESVIDIGDHGERQDSTQRIGGGDDAFEGAFGLVEV